MARTYKYECDECHRPCARELLTVKNVRFLEIGEKPKQLRSRNVAWLCPDCVVKDPHWNQEAGITRHSMEGEYAVPPPKPPPPVTLREPAYEQPDLDSALRIGSQWQAPAEV